MELLATGCCNGTFDWTDLRRKGPSHIRNMKPAGFRGGLFLNASRQGGDNVPCS